LRAKTLFERLHRRLRFQGLYSGGLLAQYFLRLPLSPFCPGITPGSSGLDTPQSSEDLGGLAPARINNFLGAAPQRKAIIEKEDMSFIGPTKCVPSDLSASGHVWPK
jgi:hypothetical protein